METIRFEYKPEALPQMQAAVLAALEAGAGSVVLDLDTLASLDDAAARGLIILLRRSREVGGEVALAVSRPDLRARLSEMALDRLFKFVTLEVAA